MCGKEVSSPSSAMKRKQFRMYQGLKGRFIMLKLVEKSKGIMPQDKGTGKEF